ncbi:MAG: uroporphyrinogen-III synthase [Actinomycetota bacterium]|nr:uroporphyrinogen-III synthase [Actinomycetota bacterium]
MGIKASNPQLKKIVVTRARIQADGLLKQLAAIGMEPILLPAIEIQPPDDEGEALRESIHILDQYDWLIFTSANGVNAFFAELDGLSLPIGTQIAVIGTGTNQAMKRFGIDADLVAEESVAEGLLRAFLTLEKEKKILLPRAAKARDVLPDNLRKAGWVVDEVSAYQTKIPEKFDSFDNTIIEADSIIFTSVSTFENFLKMYGLENIPPNIISIGPITSEAIRESGRIVAIEANPHNIQGIIEGITRF